MTSNKSLRDLAMVATCVAIVLIFSSCTRSGAARFTDPAAIERGRYLVQQVGLCGDCHTPRDQRGQPVMERQLMGSELLFKPTVPMPWAPKAPRLAGLPLGFTEDDLIAFLSSGKLPAGRAALLPPMPEYRLNEKDAEAVVAYLRSLPNVDAR